MTSLTITLPDTAQAYINEQLASGTYTTADELLTSLIEDAQERHAKQKVNAMPRSTLEKDKTIDATDEWWEQKRAKLLDAIECQHPNYTCAIADALLESTTETNDNSMNANEFKSWLTAL